MASRRTVNGAARDACEAVPGGHECEPFPTLPPSVQQPQPDIVVEHRFPRPRGHRPEMSASTLMCASWALLSGRTASSEHVVFGVGVCRPEPAAVPMCLRTASSQTVSEFLLAVQRQDAAPIPSTEHGSQQLDQRGCKFQTLLVVQQPPRDNSAPDAAAKWHRNGQQYGPDAQALVLELWVAHDGITAKANFDSRVVTPWTMRKLLQRLESVARQLVSMSPEKRLADVSTVTSHDLDEIWAWNRTVPPTVERCVHEIFEERVRLHPHAPAVCAWDGKLTYGELDTLAAKLAFRLVELGVGPHEKTIVPLCFEKSMWTTVAVLAVLKAGGAFLLLDSCLPEKRLQLMVRRVKARLMASSVSAQPLSSRLARDVLVVGPGLLTDSSGPGEEPSGQLPRQSPASLMYVSFTSGSTGAPKCIKITHSNVASALHHQADSMGLTKDSRVLDFASYSFTTAVSNFSGALAAGGCLCVPSDEDRRDKLPDVIRSLRANFIDLTPSVLQFLVPEDVPMLQVIVLGGEASRARDIKSWWGKARIIHLYGQSECTSNGTINHDASSPEEVPSIGKGAGLVTWVVDAEDHDSLAPVGCVGELLFEGPLVGDGYLDDAEKTGAAFIEDPKWLLQGAPGRPGRRGRLYKTGDLVRYGESGNLTFIGRKDTQVKIRGQRVELGEVEHWVQSFMPDAAQVVAEVIEPRGEGSSRALVAFLQMKDDAEAASGLDAEPAETAAELLPMPADVEDELAGHLPSYMVPTAFFSVQRLPMTATGKVDRKLLRQMGGSFSVERLAEMRTAGQGPKRQPTTAAERQLQKIWAAVLRLGPASIGLDDSFFHLGGDSIAAIKVVAAARKMGIGLAVADMFRHPRLEHLGRQSRHAERAVEETIPPFALLGDAEQVSSFLGAMAGLFHLDPAKIVDAYPCAPLQAGLFSLASKQSGAYVMQDVLELSPDVAVQDLCSAWHRVVRALPVLRTRIVEHNRRLLQVVLDEESRWIEATGLDRYLEADRKLPMGLGEPLARYALVRDGTGKPTWFVWTMHHAVYDGWSIRLVTAAVQRALQGSSIEPSPQPQAFVKYIDGLDSREMLDHWVRALAGYDGVPFPALPASVDGPAADQEVECRLPPSRRRLTDTTVSTVVRAAWALVVGRMSETEDVVFGATVSGRNAPVAAIDAMAAPTFATIPIRVKVAARQSVSAYLDAVQQQAVDTIPFEQAGLHRIASMSPDCRKACKFQSLLVIQPQDTDGADGILGTWQPTKQHWFNTYALMLQIRPAADGLSVNASFDSTVLPPWLVRRLLTRLGLVMRQLDALDGETSLADVVVMTAEDSDQIWRWNGAVPAPTERCAHHMVRERGLSRPSAPAICAWDGELSYGELDRLSSRLVGRLVELGVGSDVLVPLCFEKSMWTPVAMLAVLKAGGGFVLLDPSLPGRRLQVIVGQLNAAFVVCSPATLALSSGLSKTVVQLGPDSISLLEPATHPALDIQQSPTDAMFAVFTSGSTGVPKGVVLSHVNFCSALEHQLHLLGFHKDSRVFDFAAYAFDVAVHNIMATLVSGGCVCIPSDEERRDSISDAMVRMGATIADLTPSVARLVDPATVPQLETLILSGEAASVDDIRPWWGKARVINAYGPAECNISTVSRGQSSPEEVASIGKGAGLVTWVVDADHHNTLLPPGHVGELLLEGPLVCRGYLDDAEKTAQAFIENPTWLVRGPASPGQGQAGRRGRLYKTGDLVRYNEDGSLAFVGRKDAQVKIRGQRVELGEVEHWVQSFTAARQVVADVVTPQGEASSPTLVAFLQTQTRDRPALDILPIPVDVKDKLAGHLPSYMVPAVFFAVRDMPLTPTGKTDRRRLREIASSFPKEKMTGWQMGPEHGDARREPASDAERQMQTIWAKVLGIEPASIGADDGFVQIGGNSISAMAVVGEARKLGLQVAFTDIFHHPKLHQLAARATRSAGTASNTIPSQPRRGDGEQSFAQQHLWALDRLYTRLPRHLTPWAARLRGSLRLDALKTALFALERRHDALRTTFGVREGVDMQFIRPFQPKELTVVDLSSDARGLEDALQRDRTAPFDLENDPAWRVTVYRVNQQEHILSIVTHQIAADGWSLDVVRRELALFYSAALGGKDPLAHVDSIPIQYRDYAAWQKQPSQMQLQQRHLEYWIRQLETSRPAEFPFDKPRPETLSGETAALETRIDGTLCDSLQRFCRERQVTLFVVLLAAFRAAHCRLTGATDATIGTASANRDRWETRELVGPLVNVQCLRIQVADESFEELVRNVQTATLTSFANQDVPFERIITELQADKDRSRHPLVQTIFAVHSRLNVEQFRLEGVQTEQITMPMTSRFDLEFHLYQEEHAIRGSLIFSTDLYRPKTIGNVISVFHEVLRGGLADPTTAITLLPFAELDGPGLPSSD